MPSSMTCDRLLPLRPPIRVELLSLLMAVLLTACVLGQELPKATPEGKQSLDQLIRGGEAAGALRVKRDEKGQIVELSVTGAGKLRDLIGRDDVRNDLRLRDAIIAVSTVHDARRAAAWCTILQLLADASQDDLTRGFLEERNAVRLALEQKDYPAAIDNLQAAARRFERLKKPAYQAFCLEKAGIVQSVRHEYDKAIELHLRSAELLRVAFGESNLQFALALRNVGSNFKNKGDSAKALDYFQRSLGAYQRAQNKVEVATTLLEIGLVHASLKDREKAADCFDRALGLRRQARGAAHIETARMAQSIAKAWFDIEEFDRALDLYQQALIVFRNADGAAPTDLAGVLDSIGLCLQRLRRDDKALAAFEESLALKRKALGDQHRDVARTLGSLADTQKVLGLDDALANYNKALEICRKVFGERSPEVDGTLEAIAHLYFLRKDYPKSSEIYRQALEIRRVAPGASARRRLDPQQPRQGQPEHGALRRGPTVLQ